MSDRKPNAGARCILHAVLPGRLCLEPGAAKDYGALSHLHYVAGRPATFAGVWRVRYHESTGLCATCGVAETAAQADYAAQRHRVLAQPRTVAVVVLSYPTLRCLARERALHLTDLTARDRIKFVNANVRTISRVVVHPQFRALGLSSRLVAHVCASATTRYVEAIAMMGRAHPLFEKAGMTRHDPPTPDAPVYYLFDRGPI